jgi:hypothetical protein
MNVKGGLSAGSVGGAGGKEVYWEVKRIEMCYR